jgi:hypothetical protein
LMGLVDNTHPALAELLENSVISDLFTDHGLWRRQAGPI